MLNFRYMAYLKQIAQVCTQLFYVMKKNGINLKMVL